MSTTIDERVVGMRFDNKQFETNVATTMSTIEKLKQSLNLTGATKGLENIDSAARKVNMSGLGSAVETVGMKFSAMWTVADQTLRNITNSVESTAKRMISALTIDPIKTGLSEYETQIGAVQTIMANTESKGTTLDQVNSALDELNTYADKTIYNFTEMTKNIGTFTAAGVDLDTSVKSIQGIANLAAVSGSTSQQASTAMYQLSQALAAGKVSLMDWNSVVNAGMGGQVFQDALKRTATVMGTDVDALIKKYGSFRESLTQGEWLTSDVLTKTLEQFTMSAKEGSKEWDAFKKSLMDDGYTEEQALSILKMANTATDAATKVKTFTQLWDTLKETAQSGWSQTWELILGDFEDAKTLFSELYSMISPVIEASSNARNELLQGWVKFGGRDDLIASFKNVFEGLSSIIAPIKEAFRDFFPPLTVKQLYNFTKGLYVLTSKLKIGSETADKLKRAFSGVFAAADIVRNIFVSVFKAMSPLFGGIGTLGGGILDFAANLGDSVVSFNEFLESSGAFEKVTEKIRGGLEKVGEFLTNVKSGIDLVVDAISTRLSSVSGKIEGRFEPLKALGQFIMAVFKGIGDVVYKVAPYVMNIAQGIGNVLGDLMGRISSAVKDADYSKLFDTVNGGIFAAIGVFIAKFIKSGGDILDGAGGFLENINNILEGVGDAFGAFTDSMKAETLKKIAISIGILAASLLVLSLIDSDKLTSSLLAISTLFAELMGSMAIFAKILDGKKLKGLGKMALALIGLSTSLLILSAALKIMSTMSWEEMGIGLITMTVGLGALVGAVNLLPEKKVNSAARAIAAISTAMVILGAAIKIMGSMSWKEMGVGLITMTAGLGLMVGAVRLLPKDTAVRAAGMLGLATAMVALGAALKIMGSMSWKEMGVGLISLVGSLGALTASMNLMKKALPGAAAIMIVAPALVVLASSLKIFATMSWEEMGVGLASLAGSLLILAGAMALMKTALPGAAAILIIAPALAILAGVIKSLGSMSWGEFAVSMAAIAGAFVILGVAALALTPLVPVITALAGSMALFGLACAGIGVGVMAVGVGITALATALAASGGAITIFVSSLIGLIPYFIQQVGVGIIALCEVISGSAGAICAAAATIIVALVDALVISAPKLVEGALVIIDSILTALVEYTPKIVSGLFDFLIALIDELAARLPDLIQAGTNLVMSLFTGIFDSLKTIDPAIIMNAMIGVGAMAALIAALAAVAVLTPAAMIGVLGMAAVVTELSFVLAAVGALAQIPGLEWLIGEGGNLLQTIGTAIGKFVGGIIGGVASGVTSQLPQIGTDLAGFMTNAKPFLDGVASINPAIGEGAMAIAGAILAITAANVLNQLTSWISGGDSMATFAAQLVPFGESMVAFSKTVSGNIDEGAVTAAANAGKIMAEMASSLPNSGGVLGFFAGENDMGAFTEQLVPFGEAIAEFSKTVSGKVDAEAVTAAANAGKAVAELASSLPNSGGLAGLFAGDNDLKDFGSKLKSFGEAIADFSSEVSGVSTNALSKVISEVKKLVAMATDMSGIDFTSLSQFGQNLGELGRTGIDEFISAFTDASAKVMEAGTAMVEALIEGVASKNDRTKDTATATAKKAISGFETQKDEAESAGKDLGSGLVKGIKSKETAVYNAGYALGQMAVQGEKDGQQSNSPSKLTMLAGKWLGQGLIVGMDQISGSVYKSGSELGKTATGTISSTISRISDIVSSDIDAQPTIRPVLDLSDIRSGANSISSMFGYGPSVGVLANVGAISSSMNSRGQNGNADVVSAINKLRKDLGNVGNTTNYIDGITYDDGSAVSKAIKTLVREVKVGRRV